MNKHFPYDTNCHYEPLEDKRITEYEKLVDQCEKYEKALQQIKGAINIEDAKSIAYDALWES